MSGADETYSMQQLPERVLGLPVYLMLALTREGYRHAVRNKVELRMPHYVVLAVLEEAGPRSQKQIAECIALDKSDVTKLMNELENRGLVQRVNDPQDLRRHRVTLTGKGKRQLEASDRELNSSMKMFLSGLSETEYQQLQRLLLKAIRAHDPRFGGNRHP
jgi:MarR family transcriptional regulator, lower aerobic nicotinate degradation pathway regulator